jgi:hypothetical protein
MALPTTRTELKTYIRRRLGEPVITINVADDQLEERIDDALAFFQDYHFDGSEKVYLKHRVTTSNLTFTVPTTGTFSNGEAFQGLTSNAYGKAYTSNANSTFLQFTYTSAAPANTFVIGETVKGLSSNATGTVSAIALGDYDNQYLPISDLVLSISKVLPLDGFAVDRSTGLFSWNYQFLMNDLSWLSSSSVISYYLTRSHMELLNDLFIGNVNIRYNRHANRLYLDLDWSTDIKVNDYVIVEAQRILDPNTYADIWKDRFLRDYATALVKKQWGQNLIKYEGVQMPGGVTLNGRAIYDEGNREAQQMEDQIQSKYELPPEFFVA